MSRPFLPPVEFLKSGDADASWTHDEATAYTRWLATSHYENFHVVSFLLPKHLHQDFYNVYSFCRWADDLGDEIGDTDESLRLLHWWRVELRAMYAGRTTHPVFVALAGTAERHRLPPQPFEDLISAFEQDQVISQYETWQDLLNYCRYSANPVGRLVLYLCGYSDLERQTLSDATCTALQLANFWQDVSVDIEKKRVYIPVEVLREHGCTIDQVYARHFDPAFRKVMIDICAFAEGLFRTGLPLADRVNRRLAIDLELFSRGGMRVLQKIAEQDYNVLARRPSISKLERLQLLVGVLLRRGFSKAAA